MKAKNKALLLSLCAVALVAASILGTIAYLTDDESVTNTFTVGNVDITLDEVKVDENGNPVSSGERTEAGNDYHLLPGYTYTKDPTVHVVKGSENSYVRMLMTINYSKEWDAICDKYTKADGTHIGITDMLTGYDPAIWVCKNITEDPAAYTRTYELWYHEKVKDVPKDKAKDLEPLFTGISMPGDLTNADLASLVTIDTETGEITNQFKITVVAHAIQADSFTDADDAWSHFPTK